MTAMPHDILAAKTTLHRWSTSIKLGVAKRVPVDFWLFARLLHSYDGIEPSTLAVQCTDHAGWIALLDPRQLARVIYKVSPAKTQPGLAKWLDEEAPGWREG